MVHVIINPVSGAGADPNAASRRASMIRDAAAQRGIEATIAFTERPEHARELGEAAVAARASSVIVWGGDGTFNETAGALLNSSIPVGLVPAGSGNGLAAALGVPRDPARAIAVAMDGVAAAIDAGRMAGRYFFNIAGVGFDARVAALFNARGAGARGAWPYLMIGVREGCTYPARDYDVQLDGESRKYRALLIAFANGREYGLGARIAPGASLDDGLLDVIIVQDSGLIARFWHARHLALGRPEQSPPVITRRVTRAVIEADGDMEFHVDGEPGVASKRIEVEILPGALLIRR